MEMYSHQELMIMERDEIIQKQNKVIEKMASQLERMSPVMGRAIVNYEGELYDCYVGETNIDLQTLARRDASGKIIKDKDLRHTFRVVEIGKYANRSD